MTQYHGTRTLYVYGVSNFTKGDLTSYFNKIGYVKNISIPIIEGTRCEYGYIRFHLPSQAKAAYEGGEVQYGKTRKHHIGNKFVIVAYAADREEDLAAVDNQKGTESEVGQYVQTVGQHIQTVMGIGQPMQTVTGISQEMQEMQASTGMEQQMQASPGMDQIQASTEMGQHMQASSGMGQQMQASTGMGQMQASTGMGQHMQTSTGMGQQMQALTGMGQQMQTSTGMGQMQASTGMGQMQASPGMDQHRQASTEKCRTQNVSRLKMYLKGKTVAGAVLLLLFF